MSLDLFEISVKSKYIEIKLFEFWLFDFKIRRHSFENVTALKFTLEIIFMKNAANLMRHVLYSTY